MPLVGDARTRRLCSLACDGQFLPLAVADGSRVSERRTDRDVKHGRQYRAAHARPIETWRHPGPGLVPWRLPGPSRPLARRPRDRTPDVIDRESLVSVNGLVRRAFSPRVRHEEGVARAVATVARG
jgi:hypothetical protein